MAGAYFLSHRRTAPVVRLVTRTRVGLTKTHTKLIPLSSAACNFFLIMVLTHFPTILSLPPMNSMFGVRVYLRAHSIRTFACVIPAQDHWIICYTHTHTAPSLSRSIIVWRPSNCNDHGDYTPTPRHRAASSLLHTAAER